MRISFQIFNSINSEQLITVVLPFDYKRAIKGFYSGLWKDLKTSCATSYKIDKRFIRMRCLKDKSPIKSNRMLVLFPSGFRLDSPFDLNPIDFKIINLHLEALELSKGD